MKPLIIKVIIFLSILVLYKLISLSIILHTASGKNTNNFYGELTSKPKLVLVGSSNLDHNYDYKTLNLHYPSYDVIGCNLNEPSGLYALMNKLKGLRTNSKDIIVFCLPHSLYETDKFLPLKSYKKSGFTKSFILTTAIHHPYEFMLSLFDTKISDLSTLIKKTNSTSTINQVGLEFSENPEIQTDSLYRNCWVNDQNNFYIRSEAFDEEYLVSLSEIIQAEVKGKVLFRFPAIKKGEYTISPERIDYLKTNYNFINSFESSIYENEYWFNQWYHLNACGRDLNTTKFISEINSKLTLK